uniref:Putative serpin-Z8 n=1 Tax=Aegilops tauschii TaxID=37682 RepID=R7W7Y2_AEGTA
MADLAARLTKRLCDANSGKNLVFSPLSIYAVLALLAAGAGGDTLEEILRVLGARSRSELEASVARLRDGPLRDRSESGEPSVAFACGVWSDLTCPLKQAYVDAVVSSYKADAAAVDFLRAPEQATAQIDAWAAAATRNLIRSAVPPGTVDEDTRVVLANAVYFRGKWQVPFYESSTKNRPFYRLDGPAVDVPFMSNYGRHLIAEHDGFKVLKLRYKSSSPPYTSMCIFLPDACDGLGSLLERMTSSPGFLREHLPTSMAVVVEFGVPKFELTFEGSVTDVLKDLGLALPFGEGADLSEMMEDMHVQVQDGLPQGRHRVEEGSHAVLFAGHVVDPGNGAGAVMPSPPPPFAERNTAMKRILESDKVSEAINRSKRAFFDDGPESPVLPIAPFNCPTTYPGPPYRNLPSQNPAYPRPPKMLDLRGTVRSSAYGRKSRDEVF